MENERKITYIVALIGLAVTLATPVSSYLTTKETISSRITLQKVNTDAEITKIKLDKTIQIKNEAFAELACNMLFMRDFIFFAKIPTMAKEENIYKFLNTTHKEYDNRLITSFYKLYALLDRKKQEEAGVLFANLRTHYTSTYAQTYKPGLNMDFNKLEILSQQNLPKIIATEEKLLRLL